MKLYKKLLVSAAPIALAVGLSAVALAQEVTSSIKGQVVGPARRPQSGVTIIVIHEPTGTQRTVVTNESGGFSVRGLRTDGPYTVIVDSKVLRDQRIEDIHLILGEPFTLNVQLEAASNVEEIVILGTSTGADRLQTGPAQAMDASDIRKIPSISRDIKDSIRTSPLVFMNKDFEDEVSIGGKHTRSNSLTLDGVAQNDDFGLNANGYPTQRSPFSIDFVDQIQLQAAPFSVEYGGFTGGTINVVTKSGTNDFSGSAYYYFSDDGMVGDESDGHAINLGSFDEKTYGATLGGPILQDRLFFFAGYEWFERTSPAGYGPIDSNATNKITGVTINDVERIQAAAETLYGFNAGGYDVGELVEEDEKILLKVDWNINEDHRLAATYQYTEGNSINPQNTFGSNLGLTSNWYNLTQTLDSMTFHLFSDWTSNFSTEVKLNFKSVETGQDSLNGSDFALMEIATAGGGTVYVGPDFYRHGNELSNDTKTFKVKGQYYAGEHLMTFGWERQDLDIFNLFVPGSEGSYTFDSVADFEAGISSGLFYQNAYTGNERDGAAEWGYSIDSFYVQDEWDIRSDLTAVFGIRYENYTSSSTPSYNPNFEAREGFRNDVTIDGMEILMPRFGFNYSPTDHTTIRGGVGIFSGGNPNVWVSNSYSNDGQTIVNTYLPGPIAGVDAYTIPAAAQAALVPGNGRVDLIDPNFRVPSTLKASIGLDHEFQIENWGEAFRNLSVSMDYLYSEERNPIVWKELRREQIDTAPDGRPIYDSAGSSTDYDLMVTNGNGGEIRVFAIGLNKSFEDGYFDGLELGLGYAHTDATELHPGTSSTSASNYGKFAVFSPNDPSVSISNNEIEDRWTFSASYEKDFWAGYFSKFYLFGVHHSGRPFSYTFAGNRSADPFGEQGDFSRRDRQLFYVPTGPGDPLIASVDDWAALEAFIKQSGLSAYRGQIAPRNAFKGPDVTSFDFRFEQEFPGWRESHRSIFTFDIENIGNLINSDWGLNQSAYFHYVQPVADVNIVGGQYEYTNITAPGTKPLTIVDHASVWKIQFGFRYEF